MTTATEKKHPEIPLTPVDSSQIHAIGHDAATGTLAIQFKRAGGPGGIYHYANFSVPQFDAFFRADSIGSHFGKHIKPETEKHPFTKIS